MVAGVYGRKVGINQIDTCPLSHATLLRTGTAQAGPRTSYAGCTGSNKAGDVSALPVAPPNYPGKNPCPGWVSGTRFCQDIFSPKSMSEVCQRSLKRVYYNAPQLVRLRPLRLFRNLYECEFSLMRCVIIFEADGPAEDVRKNTSY